MYLHEYGDLTKKSLNICSRRMIGNLFGGVGNMMKVQRCKRCHGAMILDRDEFGWYEECMQCGHTQDVNALGEPSLVPIAIGDPESEEKYGNRNKIDYTY